MNPPLCRGRQLADPLADGTERNVEWSQFPQPPLGFPRGEAGFFDKRHFGTDWQKSLMRGGDRLVYECSWMSGICSGFLHSTEKSKTFSHRHPSSVSPAGSEEPSWLTASPRGKPRGRLRELVPFNELLTSVSFWAAAPLGSPNWRPLQTQKFLTSTIQQGAL